MTYLVLSNLILILVPLMLAFVQRKSNYPERLDFAFSVLTLFIILFGFLPEHVASMGFNDYLLIFFVFIFLEVVEKFSSLEKFSTSKGAGRVYFIVALVFISLHAFLDGMGFNMENMLLQDDHHHDHGHGHGELHSHDNYSLSLGLLLHRFPIGVLIYQKFISKSWKNNSRYCFNYFDDFRYNSGLF